MVDNKDTHTSTVSYLHDSDQDEKSSRFDGNTHATHDKDQYVAGYDAKLVTKSGNVIDAEGNVIVTSADSGSDIEGGLRDNIFLDPEVANYYREIYENAHYEGRHVFDPELTWTKEEERKIVWKL
ncbi:hypothetical protein D0Z00_004710, partial [Geotrichum galactomycetum]